MRQIVGISACSNGQSETWDEKQRELNRYLNSLDLEVLFAKHLYAKTDVYAATDQERAAELMSFYRNHAVKDIFDISGGDLANGVLPYLDYEVIAASDICFWGYSDLTTVINAIYAMTGKPSVLYSIQNLVSSESVIQRKRFSDYLTGKNRELFHIDYRFLRGSYMRGVIAGGNIRCFLKLAGTKYWPKLEGKILFLESWGGESGQIATLLNQLEQLGVFDVISGILLGTFTAYEQADLKFSVFDLLKMHISDTLPVAETRDVGHGHDSKALVIGNEMFFN